MLFSNTLKKMQNHKIRLCHIIVLFVFISCSAIALNYYLRFKKLSLDYEELESDFDSFYYGNRTLSFQHSSFYRTVKFFTEEAKIGNKYYLDSDISFHSINEEYLLFRKFGLIDKQYEEFNYLPDSLRNFKIEFNNLILSETLKNEVYEFFSNNNDVVNNERYFDGFYCESKLDKNIKINNQALHTYIEHEFWNNNVKNIGIKTRIGAYVDVTCSGDISAQIFLKSGTFLDSLFLSFINDLPKVKPGMINDKTVNSREKVYFNNLINGPIL